MCIKNDILNKNQWVILKFGGSSVAEPRHWKTITQVIQQKLANHKRPILVLSALKNVSNQLEGLLHQSVAGVHPNAILQIKALHIDFASQLGLDMTAQLTPIWQELAQIGEQINQEQSISPKHHAQVVAKGEILSTLIGCAYLQKQGLNAVWQDARQLLIAQQQPDLWHHYTSNQCDYQHNTKTQAYLSQVEQLVVTQGFIAADANQHTVLLGREGSDTSAAYLGAIMQAESIEIWTDVPGVFSANPKEIPTARQLPYLEYQQAEQLAQLGAKVLHPRAIAPAKQYQIPLWVKSTNLPKQSGTLINGQDIYSQKDNSTKRSIKESDNYPIAIALESDVLWLTFSSVTTKPFNKEQHLVLNKLMDKLGFDRIIHQENQAQNQYLFKYANSDQQQPDNQTIQHRLSSTLSLTTNLEIKSHLGLISFQASSTSQKTNNKLTQDKTINENGWITKCEKSAFNWLAENNNREVLIDIIKLPELGSLIFVVTSEQLHQYAKYLHQQTIESADNQHIFGESWIKLTT